MSNQDSENMDEDLTQVRNDSPHASNNHSDLSEDSADSTENVSKAQETSPTEETSVRLGTTDSNDELRSDALNHSAGQNDLVVGGVTDGEITATLDDEPEEYVNTDDHMDPAQSNVEKDSLENEASRDSDSEFVSEVPDNEETQGEFNENEHVVDSNNDESDTNELDTVTEQDDSNVDDKNVHNMNESSHDDSDMASDAPERVDGDALVEDYLADDRLQPEDYVQHYDSPEEIEEENVVESDDQSYLEDSNEDQDVSAKSEEDSSERVSTPEENVAEDYTPENTDTSENAVPAAAYAIRSEKYDEPKRKGGFGKGLVAGGICIGLIGLAGGYVLGGDSVRGPKVAAAPIKMEPTACERFEDQGFECDIAWESDDDTDAEELIRQSIDEGDRATEGSSITLFYSSGPSSSQMPRVKGLSIREAQEKLRAKGVKTEEIKKVPNSGLSVDTVVKSDVAEGETVKNGDSVVLEVSNGELRAEDWVGENWKTAQKSAENRGFTVEINKVRNGAPYGVVYRQSLAPNEKPDDDNEIELTVSEPAQEESRIVPSLFGQSQEDAQDTLMQEGFENVNVVTVASNEESGTVIATNPSNGNEATSLDEITLIVSE